MRKALTALLLVLAVLLTSACADEPTPPSEEGYTRADAQYLASRINSDLSGLIEDALGTLSHTSLLGEADFVATLGDGLQVLYDGASFAITDGTPLALVSFESGAYAVRTDDGALSVSSFASLLDGLGISKSLHAFSCLALERVIYSDLTYGDDGYYYLDTDILYAALLDGYMNAFDYEFPEATDPVRSLYQYTAKALLDSLGYSVSFRVKDKTLLSVRISLDVTEEYTELTEREQLASAALVAECFIPNDSNMPCTASLDLSAEMRGGGSIALSLSQSAVRQDAAATVTTDINVAATSLSLSEMSDNGFTAKAFADVIVSGCLTVCYPLGFPEMYDTADLSLSVSVSDPAVSIYDQEGRLTNFETDGVTFTHDDISALTEAAQQYDGASLDARLDMTYAQGGDLTVTLTQSPSSITYLGDIVYGQVTLDSTFDRYAAVISDCERYEQIAHAMMNDLITNRFSEPFVYSPSDLPLHVVVIGEKFILTDAPDAVADAVRVTLVGGRYTRAEQ